LTVRTSELLRAEDTALLVIDVQERFRAQIAAFDRMVGRIRTLALGAALLDVPVVVTEQYPQGLGSTVAELADALQHAERIEKREFDDVLRRLGRRQLLLVGIEAHVCVHQTATELLGRGLSVHLALDAIESRDPFNREAAVARMLADGAHSGSAEMALFELMRTAAHDRFRDVQALVKELPAHTLEPALGGV
jgi:nicotinamidase-related amidase